MPTPNLSTLAVGQFPVECAISNDVGLGGEDAQMGCVTVMLERPLLSVSMTGLEHNVRRLWVDSARSRLTKRRPLSASLTVQSDRSRVETAHYCAIPP